MELKNQQEQFSLAYVKAIAAKLGYDYLEKKVDNDSFDIEFSGDSFIGKKIEDPTLRIQMKCCMRRIIKDGKVNFQVKKKNYDDLRRSNLVCPRYLVVLLVPNKIDDWLSETSTEMILRNKAYWYSLKDAPPIIGKKKSTTIHIPITQIFDENGFKYLMNLASDNIRI